MLLQHFTIEEVKWRWRRFKLLFLKRAKPEIGVRYRPRGSRYDPERRTQKCEAATIEVLDFGVGHVVYRLPDGSVQTRSRNGFEKNYIRTTNKKTK